MPEKEKKVSYFEHLADELKAFLLLQGKKHHRIKENLPEEKRPPESFHFDVINVPESESHNISLAHVLKIEEAVKTYKKLGKAHLANALRDFTEYLVNDPHLVHKEKNEIVEKFADLIKEIATPEIFQKTRLINILYPEVKSLVAKNDELESRWADLEAALASSKLQ